MADPNSNMDGQKGPPPDYSSIRFDDDLSQHPHLEIPGASKDHRDSISADSHHSALSTALLGEHDRSMRGLPRSGTDRGERIASWITNMSLDNLPHVHVDIDEDESETELPTTSTIVADKADDIFSASQPHVQRQSTPEIVLQEDKQEQENPLKTTSSQAKIDKIQKMLNTDEDGKEMTVPGVRGRYRSHQWDDQAFTKINFAELSIVRDPESMSQSSQMSLSTVRDHMEAAAFKLQRAHYLARMSRTISQSTLGGFHTPQDVIHEDGYTADNLSSLPSDTDVRSQATGITPVTQKAPTRPHGGPGGSKMASAVKTAIGMRKWHGRSQKKAFGKATLQAFTKDRNHYLFVQETMDHVGVEVPLPLKKLMIMETHDINKVVVNGYEKSLGKKDPLTIDAKEKMEELSASYKFLDFL